MVQTILSSVNIASELTLGISEKFGSVPLFSNAHRAAPCLVTITVKKNLYCMNSTVGIQALLVPQSRHTF
jgi:hypothetical protein